MARLRSRTVYRRIKPVFTTRDPEFGALLARMCVLYEDLRLEVYGGMAEKIPECDQTSVMYRKLYFLRRSTITLVEFRGALQRLSENEQFRALRETFSEEQLTRLNEAEEFFGRLHPLLKSVRNDCGGHFQLSTATAIVNDHLNDAEGALEVDFGAAGSKQGVFFRFAYDLVASSFTLQRPGGEELQPFVRMLFTSIQEGWGHVVKVMHAVSLSTVLRDFGF